MVATEQSLDILETQQIDNALVVRFHVPALVDEYTIARSVQRLARLVGEGYSHIVLNLESVEDLTSDMVGYLLGLQRRAKACGCRLVLCQLHPELETLFVRLTLHRLFAVCSDEAQALRAA